MHSFLLIGQSNMAGRGFLQEAHDIDTSHIYTLRNGRWQKMFRPINPDRSFSGVSLAESFAECYAQKYGVDVGLICCADGGTKLEQWMPGEVLFDNAVNQAMLAARTSKIMGVLWHQGESDAHPPMCNTYQARFEKMMLALREKLQLFHVPFVLGGLGDYLKALPLEDYVYVNRALQDIARDNAMTAFVSAEGLTSNPDNLHFDAQSLYTFGIRYFEAFEAIRPAMPQRDEKSEKEDLVRTQLELL